MVTKVPPPPPIATNNPQFNRWLLELTSILNGSGGVDAAEIQPPVAPLASPAFTGNPTGPTQAPGTDSADLATTAYADAAVTVEQNRATAAEALLAPLASPAFTGSPTGPTQSGTDNSTKLATTAQVQAALAAYGGAVRNGSGVPAAGLGNNGDLYINNTGGAGTRLYGKISGSWVAIA